MKVLYRLGIVILIIFAFAAAPARAQSTATYYVVGVQNYLQVHSDPSEDSYVLTRIPRAVSEITGYPSSAKWVDGQSWIRIRWKGINGYVNKLYLEESN
jgi:hypothetical protein